MKIIDLDDLKVSTATETVYAVVYLL